MAYKSKEKFLERDGKTMSYCHVDPKLGKKCQAHIHPADLEISRLDAKRLRQLGEELISIAETAETSSFVTPEEMLKKLGLNKAKAKTPAEANAWLEQNSIPTEIIPLKTKEGKWLQPNPELGPPKCEECGKPLEQRILNTGQKVWHHTGHAELDNYYDINESPYAKNALVPNQFDELTQNDIDLITANVNIGNTYLDYNEDYYGPITVGRQWGTPQSETSHATYPAQACRECGGQDVKPYYKKTSGLFVKKNEGFPYVECNSCKYKDPAYLFNR